MTFKNLLFIFFSIFIGTVVLADVAHAADEKFLSCGKGYVLVAKTSVDGIPFEECKKLWCRDIETGKSMGNGNSANSGYKTTSAPVELCDAENNCIECFGDRRWCANEKAGSWNPEYGAYTYRGADTANHTSYQKGGCFAWRLEKPNCPNNTAAILKGGEWVCVTSSGTTIGGRESGVRRTGTIRRIR